MNNRPPLNEAIGAPLVSPGWGNWFGQVFLGLPWKRGFNATATLNFGSIASHSQAALTATISGVRAGDAVQVTAPDVSGVNFSGSVTADDTVTVYAKNYTAGAVDPPSQTFRIVVLQT